MSKSYKKSLIGNTYGYLTVVEFFPCDDKRAYWIVECNCEDKTRFKIRSDSLTTGNTTSCGCAQRRRIDLTGQKFSKLTAVKIDKTKTDLYKEVYWFCECDCGKTPENYSARGTHLTSGGVKSCGCSHYNNITGQKFGRLTAIQSTEQRDGNQNVIWYCECDCGGKKYTTTEKLIQGNTLSCGCLHSKAESEIQKILDDNNVKYKTEHTYSDLLSKGTRLRFDFVVFNDDMTIKYLIEYQGRQHYEQGPWGNETLEERQLRDKMKVDYCKKNNIPLICIPYWEYDNLNIDMLKLETTKFLIGENNE